MKATERFPHQRSRRGWRVAALVLGVLSMLAGCSHLMMMMHGQVDPPPASEFGFGPRTSSNGLYEVSIEPMQPLKVRQLHTMKLTIASRGAGEADGRTPVDDATITVDGGMPQHGHGLPTRPQVTSRIAPGTYQVEGVRFNMGGWWELEFHIASAAGTDSVTFNLDL